MMNEILTPAEMYRADALAAGLGISEEVLIERAGLAVAHEVIRRFAARPTVVMCGPGKNGKDGMVVARHLKDWGWPVLTGTDVQGARLIVDALYGAGLNRDFDPGLAAAINNSGATVVAIDVPSGLDGLTGMPRGASVRADLTVTFFRKKPAHVLYPGRAICGDLVVADIGIPGHALTDIRPSIWENSKPSPRQAEAEAHKFSRGHAAFWSGGAQSSGAARLAAWAAQRSGTGVVTILGTAPALAVHAAQMSSVLLREIAAPENLDAVLEDKRLTAICLGPAAGIGEPTRQIVLRSLRGGPAIVLDADALSSFEGDPNTLFNAIKARRLSVVLTPHAGEFRRLFPLLMDRPASKIEVTRAAAKLSGAIVLNKGPDTVIAHPDGRAVVNTNGTSRLAIAGSGDVLAGIITGLLAQGESAFEAACAGAWLHADAATRLAQDALTAEDLIAGLA